MAQCDQPVSGSDIYHKLGALEGKVDALIVKTTEYKNDLQVAFDRIRLIENRQSWIMGGAVVVSSIMPLVMHIVINAFHVRIETQPEATKTVYVANFKVN